MSASFICDLHYRGSRQTIEADYLIHSPERTGSIAVCAEDLHPFLRGLQPADGVGIEVTITVLPSSPGNPNEF